MPLISIIMPAYGAAATLPGAVESVLFQAAGHLEIVVIADDETDYAAVLGRAGLDDPRIRHVRTGGTATGSANARNVGLEAARGDLIAILDADDRFLPGKLAAVCAALETASLVSTALSVATAGGASLRRVAAGPDSRIPAAEYKFINFSMDSMIAYDRRAGDPRIDATLSCLTDLDLVLRLFATRTHCLHLGAPLHEYRKQAVSISNGPGATDRFVATKRHLIAALAAGRYPMADPDAAAGFVRFLEISLEAEKRYAAAIDRDPGLIFEDQIEPLLIAASTSSA